MNVTIDPLQTLDFLSHAVVLVALFLYLRKLNRQVVKLESFRSGLIAHAKANPRPPTKELIQVWLSRYEELVDDRKKERYLKKLVDVGVLDTDGNRIDAEVNGD